jgi:hypothetical protein
VVTKTKDDGRWALESGAEAQALAQRGECLRAGVFCLLVWWLQRLLQRRRRRRRVHKFSVSMLLLVTRVVPVSVVPVPLAVAVVTSRVRWRAVV